jgi:hypothetical protein
MENNSFRLLRRAATGNSNSSVLGDALSKYVARVGGSRGSALQESSLEILDLLTTNGAASSSGLVLGHVQSGKTASIIGVIAAARDNNFPVVVIAAGMTELLQGQTKKRVSDSLSVTQIRGHWLLRMTTTKSDLKELTAHLRRWIDWRGGNSAEKPPTTIFIPLKTNGVEKTALMIRKAMTLVEQDLPLLVIDDESDSASPNNQSERNRKTGSENRSATSRRIMGLFESSSESKFLMYTATPQANLLMSLSEEINPDFCYLLNPGEGYMGFSTYFDSDDSDRLISKVSTGDIVKPTQTKFGTPESAIQALATFVVGCAIQLRAGQLDISSTDSLRTLMMQVSSTKRAHAHYAKIAESVTFEWKDILRSSPGSVPNYDFLVKAHADLTKGEQSTEGFQKLHRYIKIVLDNLRVEIMNSDNEELGKERSASSGQDRLNWHEYPFWILVGGIYMDRGFTVEGLQVTYMPRGPAQNEDTITQRARFFGYHSSYSQYIRIFMPDLLRATYKSIGRNQEDLRRQMEKYGRDLKSWRRDFGNLDSVNLTRKSVIGRQLGSPAASWVYPQDLHHVSEAQQSANKRSLFALMVALQKHATNQDELLKSYGVHEKRKALIIESIKLSTVTKVLEGLSYAVGSSGPRLIAEQMLAAESHGLHKATLVFTDHLDTKNLSGKQVGPQDKIGNSLMSGASSKTFIDGERNYPGDRIVYSPTQVTIQIRIVKLKPWYGFEDRDMEFAWWAWINPALEGRLREIG